MAKYAQPDGKRAQEHAQVPGGPRNRRLKQIVAHQALDNWAPKELLLQKLPLKPKYLDNSGVIDSHGGSWDPQS